MEKISITDYADMLECSEGTVRSAIRAGKISEGVVKNRSGRTVGVLPGIASREWASHYNPDRTQNHAILENLNRLAGDLPKEELPSNGTGKHAEENEPAPKKKPVRKAKARRLDVPDESAPADASEIMDTDNIYEAKRKAEILKAKLLKVQLLEKEGELVNAESIRAALYDFGARVRSAVLSVPDRVIDNILASETRNEAYLLLSGALTDALKTLADDKLKI